MCPHSGIMGIEQSEGLYVLLADDDYDDRMFFQEAIDEISLNVRLNTVKDGNELIDFLSRETIVLPHVLFMDLNMPFKNGLQCLAEIRQNHLFHDICILMYSTTARQSDIDEAFEKGANFFVRKPSSFTLLKEILHRIFSMDLKSCRKPSKEEFFFRL